MNFARQKNDKKIVKFSLTKLLNIFKKTNPLRATTDLNKSKENLYLVPAKRL